MKINCSKVKNRFLYKRMYEILKLLKVHQKLCFMFVSKTLFTLDFLKIYSDTYFNHLLNLQQKIQKFISIFFNAKTIIGHIFFSHIKCMNKNVLNIFCIYE